MYCLDPTQINLNKIVGKVISKYNEKSLVKDEILNTKSPITSSIKYREYKTPKKTEYSSQFLFLKKIGLKKIIYTTKQNTRLAHAYQITLQPLIDNYLTMI